jgi:hypothetical protein
MIKKISIFIIGLVFSASFLSAQSIKDAINKQPKGIVYDKEASGFLRLHTNGYTIGGSYGTLKTYYKTNYWQFELVHIKHPREYTNRSQFSAAQNGATGSSFIFGKQNSFFALHGAYGQKRYFSGKAKKQGVAVGMSYSVGPSLGIIKPYYLELFTDVVNGRRVATAQKYTEENGGSFLDVSSIAGGAGFGYGFDELSLVPGGHGKVALHLDWGAFDEYVRAVEIGLMLDVYAKEIPIMLTDDNRPYFINLYFSVEIGKRW